MRDYALGSTFDLKFTTRAFSTGVPTTLSGVPVVKAFVDNNTTGLTAGITLSVDFASIAGLNNVRIVATSGNGYASGANYAVVITTGTVGGTSVVGEVVGEFSIEAQSPLRPTTAGRTLVVDAAGLADSNVVKLGPTGSGTAQTARDIGASVLLSSGSGTGQLDFTSGVVKANLAQILGTALTETAGQIAGAFKKFFNVAVPTGTVNSIPDAVAGAAGGLLIAGSNAATTVNITGNITGNLSGSVGSVTGAVGSVTGAVGSVTGNLGGNVNGNVVGSVGSVTGAVGSVTGDVGGNVTGSVGSVVGAVGSVTGNVGGNVTGSVGSVVGAVGSVTGNLGGNVNGNVVGSVGSVTGAVGSVTGNVGGNVTGSVGSVVGAVGSVTGNVGGNLLGTLTQTEENNIADSVIRRTAANARASARGDALEFRSILGAVSKLVNKVDVNVNTLEIKEEDDTTNFGTQTITTTPGADPITALDTV